MTVPCEQKDTIDDTRRKVDDIGRNIGRLCESNERLASEMREMNQALVSHMLSNKEYSVRLEAIDKAMDVLFVRSRKVEDIDLPDLKERVKGVESCSAYMKDVPDRVKDIEAWQNRMRGALIVFPGICTAISTIAAVVAIYFAVMG